MKKINVKRSIVYRFDSRDDLANCIERIGENGYFSDFEDFSEYKEAVLKLITVGEGIGYPYGFSDIDIDNYKYYIPKDLAIFEEPEEKKYRPYMYLDELPFNVGDVIRYRGKKCCSECKGLVAEIGCQNNDDCELDNIIIGGINCTPQELFDHYELLGNDCQYRPFGVGVEEDEKD